MRYGSLYRFWIGTKLYIVVSDASDIEYILHNPNCIDKDDSYRFFEESFATIGLFTIKSELIKKERFVIVGVAGKGLFNKECSTVCIGFFRTEKKP